MKIFSGIQPTGEIHIGNYLGAIKQWVALQKNNDCVFSIVDLHSLTIPYEPKKLKKRIFQTAAAFLAAGVDPKKSILFVQSHVYQHAELCWLLNTVCPVGDLQRMTQYKEKAKQFKGNINAGLLEYPVLMAADILLYKTEKVPVGRDQIQHVEISRRIARKFNQRFGKTFIEPEALMPKTGAKIMALNRPEKKMSKSLPPENYISLFDSPQKIKKKIMAAVTDNDKKIKYDPKRKPGISNLLTIYSLFEEEPIPKIEARFKNKGYGEFKELLAKLLIESLKPFRQKEREISSQEEYIQKIFREGAKKARHTAAETMREVRKKMGLI